MTGETGAGKSIVVDSINLVLGERADRNLIRTGCDKATVEAIFDISDNQRIKELLAAESLEANGGLMSIYREISGSDRNICRVCGVIVPLSFLRQITEILVDIHGQHEHQSLLDERQHLNYLDAFGDDGHQNLRRDVALNIRYGMKRAPNTAPCAKKASSESSGRNTWNPAFVNSGKPSLSSGEMETLKGLRQRFADHEKIANALKAVYQNMTANEGTNLGVNALLRGAVEESQRIAEYDERFKHFVGAPAERVL